MNTEVKHKILQGLFAATVLMSSLSAHAALTPVTQDGNLMVSDSLLNVSWADVASPTDLTWSATAAAGSAQAWVATLNTEDYGGYSNWRLATGDGSQSYSPVNPANELGSLFYTELGNTHGSPATNTSPFTTLMTGAATNYWSGTQGSPSSNAWLISPYYGIQVNEPETIGYSALAVRSGQVSAVPLPAAAWLLVSGLASLGMIGRRRKGSELASRS